MNQSYHSLVIWNSSAGSAESASWLREQIENTPFYSLRQTTSAAQAKQLAQQAGSGPSAFLGPDQRFDVVIAAGGDGTIHTVANGLLQGGGKAALGMLPLGTGNDLCRSLGVPIDLRQAWDVLQTTQPKKIDVIEIGAAEDRFQPRYMLNVAAAGNSHRVTECVTPEQKQMWGAWCYVKGAIDVLTDLKGYPMRFEFDDEPPVEMSVWSVVIANGRMAGGGVEVAPHAQLDDGLMELIAVEDSSPVDIPSLAAEFVFGDYTQDERVFYRRVRRLTVNLEQEAVMVADGEEIRANHLEFSVAPSALSVMAGPANPR